jgi:uncharacterized membrane protein YoaK (UPF0700 family)
MTTPEITAAPSQSLLTRARRVLVLGVVAGYVDALGFIVLNGVYAAAMTGNTTQLGILLVRGEWSHLSAVGATVAAFLIGALLSSFIRRRIRRYPLELALMAALVLLVQAIRLCAPHAVTLELLLLAAAMGMQGQIIARIGVASMQTIVVTGNLLKFADGFVARYAARGGANERDGEVTTSDIVLPACAWVAYTLGAASGAFASARLEAPFVVPAVLLMLTATDLLVSNFDQPEWGRKPRFGTSASGTDQGGGC